jgi:cytochrome c biogenesis protein CcmG/thiol:disulfide interchange protein DsbE
MKIKILPIFFTVIFIIFFLILYKGLQNPNIYSPKTDIKKNIPTFKAKLFDTDNQINSEEIFENEGFYLINVWASWCLPCRDEHPILISLKDQKNLKIIGLNYKDKNENAKKFLKEFDNPYDIIFVDQKGTIAIEWGAYGVPETFLIYDKKIIKKIIGPLNENLLTEIKKLIE